MSTNNTKADGKEIDIESQLIEELSQNGTDKLRKLFLQWQSEITARLEQFNQTLQLLIDKPQLSLSNHTSPQGEDQELAEVNAWIDVFEAIRLHIGVGWNPKGDTSQYEYDLIDELKQQGFTIKKQPLTKLSEGSDK